MTLHDMTLYEMALKQNELQLSQATAQFPK